MSEAEVAGLLAEDLAANAGVIVGITILLLGTMVAYLLKVTSLTAHKLTHLLRVVAAQQAPAPKNVTYQLRPEILSGMRKQGRKRASQKRGLL